MIRGGKYYCNLCAKPMKEAPLGLRHRCAECDEYHRATHRTLRELLEQYQSAPTGAMFRMEWFG